ncbi:LOB domain-containing protein 33-like [Euphorbia lathyris]|uniref:LOB domain-containing protein 33-like n=1 Tax=Euphorbia lathyris TaxID=212925 RepID=UPI00331366A6
MTGVGSSCGACKFLRRKCTTECVFSPYFSYEQATAHFAAVHKVFGASNVSKLLLQLPVQNRSDAAITISYEALARMRDPVYGCVAHIFALQQQIASLQEEIEILGHHMANLTVGIGSDGIPRTTSNPNCDIHISSPEDAMNNQYHQSQMGAQVNNSGYTAENQSFDSQMNVEVIPSCEWEDQNPFLDFQTNPLDILVEGLDQDIFPYCPWLHNGN